jgi:hypothetical protein
MRKGSKQRTFGKFPRTFTIKREPEGTLMLSTFDFDNALVPCRLVELTKGEVEKLYRFLVENVEGVELP